ncbi:MAG: hypothetical protein O2794_00690 [bacterium]|nr:hypothetical protein [bacterium]
MSEGRPIQKDRIPFWFLVLALCSSFLAALLLLDAFGHDVSSYRVIKENGTPMVANSKYEFKTKGFDRMRIKIRGIGCPAHIDLQCGDAKPKHITVTNGDASGTIVINLKINCPRVLLLFSDMTCSPTRTILDAKIMRSLDVPSHSLDDHLDGEA